MNETAMQTYIINFPDTKGIGQIAVRGSEEFITHIYMHNDALPADGPSTVEPYPLLLEAERQLQQYFSGNLKVFSLPLAPEGTPFMKSVWGALLEVPYGKTTSYGQIAARIGRPKASRADRTRIWQEKRREGGDPTGFQGRNKP